MIVLATPKWDALHRRVARSLRRDGASAAVKLVERTPLLRPELRAEALERASGIWVLKSRLHVVVYRGDKTEHGRPGDVEMVGVTSRRVITNAGVAYLVDAWQGTVEMEDMKYHGLGTATTAEAASQTALTTELTTQYSPTNSTRATGTLTESSAPVFVTVGTNTVDASATIEEHGIFSNATVGSGVLWDRSLTGTQTLSASDSLQATYSMTASAGG